VFRRENQYKNTLSRARARRKRKKNLFNSFSKLIKDERLHKITGVLFLFIISPYLIIAFTSYLFTWRADMSKVKIPWIELLFNSNETVENWLGKFGAIISHELIYNWFGITSFLFILIFSIIGFKILFKISLLPVKKTLQYSLFVLVWLSVTLGYVFQNSKDIYHLMGGSFGYYINNWLEGLLGNIGTGFLIVFALVCFLIIAFNISFDWFKSKITAETGQTSSVIESDAVLSAKDGSDSGGKEDSIEETETIELSTDGANTDIKENINQKPQQKPEDDSKEPDLELTIEKGKEDDTLSPEEVEAKSEFSEYDPKLDLPSYQMPSTDLLEDYGSSEIKVDKEELESNKDKIIDVLANFNIQIQGIKAIIGPTVTLYEIVQAPGVKISKIKNLSDDIAQGLSALGIRIIAPIPGKGTIGIEVPNRNPQIVSIRSILSSEKFINAEMELPIGIGKTISNETFIADLTKMPHLLIAGATGQGKSVGLNAIMLSLLYKKHPSQVKLVLIDPKRLELTLYKKIERHFLAKLPDAEQAIVSDTKKVGHTLHSLCNEMEQRLVLLEDAQVRDIKEYNLRFISRKLNPNKGHRYLPYIVLIIDEFADLIMSAGKEIESPLTRLAQKSRAIGIHLIIATQRPSVNIITGTIKANFPVRIVFRVISQVDSKTIIDTAGADQLTGKGDMLLSTGGDMIRLQCAFVDTPEVKKVTDFIGSQQGYADAFLLPEYEDESSAELANIDSGERDPLFEEAARIVVQHQQGSASLLQRRLKLGYNRAGRIIDQLEAAGIVGPPDGSKARQVLFPDEYSLEQFLNGPDKDKSTNSE